MCTQTWLHILLFKIVLEHKKEPSTSQIKKCLLESSLCGFLQRNPLTTRNTTISTPSFRNVEGESFFWAESLPETTPWGIPRLKTCLLLPSSGSWQNFFLGTSTMDFPFSPFHSLFITCVLSWGGEWDIWKHEESFPQSLGSYYRCYKKIPWLRSSSENHIKKNLECWFWEKPQPILWSTPLFIST